RGTRSVRDLRNKAFNQAAAAALPELRSESRLVLQRSDRVGGGGSQGRRLDAAGHGSGGRERRRIRSRWHRRSFAAALERRRERYRRPGLGGGRRGEA